MRYALLIHYQQPAVPTLTEAELKAGMAAFQAYARALDDAVLGELGELRKLRAQLRSTELLLIDDLFLRKLPANAGDELADERNARLDEALADAVAVVMMPWMLLLAGVDPPRFDDGRLARAPRLRVIAGTHDFRLGWIDLDAAGRRNVAVVDTSRTMTPTVAEFGVGITFALLRDLPEAIDLVRGGGWMPPMDVKGHVFRDLADCRVGLAGYGSINRHVRRFVRPYGCEVATHDPLIDPEILAADDVVGVASLAQLVHLSERLDERTERLTDPLTGRAVEE